MNKKSLTELFFTFLKIGLFTFGGGYAMISLIENNCVEKKKWITHDEMMDVTVIAESTPGPIAINCATFVGYKHSGFLGAIIATIAVIIPSFIIIYIISKFLDNFLEINIISDAFKGIKIAVAFLIINAALNMIQKMHKTRFSIAVVCISFMSMLTVNYLALNFSSIAFMLIFGAISTILFVIDNHRKMEGKTK